MPAVSGVKVAWQVKISRHRDACTQHSRQQGQRAGCRCRRRLTSAPGQRSATQAAARVASSPPTQAPVHRMQRGAAPASRRSRVAGREPGSPSGPPRMSSNVYRAGRRGRAVGRPHPRRGSGRETMRRDPREGERQAGRHSRLVSGIEACGSLPVSGLLPCRPANCRQECLPNFQHCQPTCRAAACT